MSIFAGVYCRRKGANVPEGLFQRLRGSLSRDGRDEPREFTSTGFYLAKVDIGVIGAPAFLEQPDGAVSVLAGEPLLATADPRTARSRTADLELLHDDWQRGADTLAATARGPYCAAHYRADRHQLTLVADKLAIRPVYVYVNDEYVIFATALRILEGLAEVPKVTDLRAVTEMATLGCPLGVRTPYVDIMSLGPAHVLRVAGDDLTRTQYWRWDTIAPSTRPEPELVRQAYDTFMNAVTARLRDDRTAVAFLSGGLDSRSIVAALCERGVQVETYNFSLPGTQDQVLATGFARAAGTAHHELPMKAEVELRFTEMLAAALGGSSHHDVTSPSRRQYVWSGDGGSMPAGHIYQTRPMIDRLREGNRDAAIDLFLRQQGAFISGRLLKPAILKELEGVPREGMEEEMDAVQGADPGRLIYLFLLLNGQRRILAKHFDELDNHRLEFQLPFFDSDFLAAMIQVPVELCLYHAFYMKWLALFPASATSVPFQSYPGHIPSTLPIPDSLQNQWKPKKEDARAVARRAELVEEAAALLASPHFPSDILRKNVVRLTSWLYRRQLRDYSYLLRHASLYFKYLRRSEHRWRISRLARARSSPAPRR